VPEEGNMWTTATRTCREDRGPSVNVTLKMLLRRLTRKAELPEIRFHDLRHTCATLLLSKNVHPKIV
jgi:integrase